jgi:RsiW-degrading membrane proteinase PrsW (M82 family)
MALTEQEIISDDIPRYTIVAGGVIATLVFANLLVSKLHDTPKVKQNMNMALLLSGAVVVTMGILGSQYFKYKEKKNAINSINGTK